MRTRTPAVFTSVAAVLAVSLGVFASASLATQNVVSQQEDVITDEMIPLDALRTSGRVKVVEYDDEKRAYQLDFTARFAMPQVDDEQKLDLRGAPSLVMDQSISYPTTAVDQNFVGPLRLPFASETLALTVKMPGECFESYGRSGYRLPKFDPQTSCATASLSLDGTSFDVTDLFVKLDAKLMQLGRDGETWVWRAKATFTDPGYPFPIVSLGQYGSTMSVVVNDMFGVAEIDQIRFNASD